MFSSRLRRRTSKGLLWNLYQKREGRKIWGSWNSKRKKPEDGEAEKEEAEQARRASPEPALQDDLLDGTGYTDDTDEDGDPLHHPAEEAMVGHDLRETPLFNLIQTPDRRPPPSHPQTIPTYDDSFQLSKFWA